MNLLSGGLFLDISMTNNYSMVPLAAPSTKKDTMTLKWLSMRAIVLSVTVYLGQLPTCFPSLLYIVLVFLFFSVVFRKHLLFCFFVCLFVSIEVFMGVWVLIIGL